MPAWLKSFGSVVPTAVLLIIGGALVWFFVRRTKTGRYMYAVGGPIGKPPIRAASIPLRSRTTAYIMNAFFLLLCALFFAAQNQAGSARIGDPLTLQAVAAAVVGGVALNGGKGSVFLAIVGAVIMSLVE